MVKSVHDGCATTRLGRTKRCRWPCICTGNAGAEREGRVLTKYAVGRDCNVAATTQSSSQMVLGQQYIIEAFTPQCPDRRAHSLADSALAL